MRTTIAVGLAILLLATSEPAKADDAADAGKAWALGQVQGMAALTPSIEAAQAHDWLAIRRADRRAHGVRDSVYEAEIAPQLDQLAATWLPTLKQQLTADLHAVTYAAVDAMHAARTEISYCRWILPTVRDGRIGPPPLAAGLFAACRSEAPGIVTGLLMGHADALDLSLAGLPRLDLAYPGWFIADLDRPDGDSPAALDPLRTRQAYVDRLGSRLQAAEPGLERQLDEHHAGQGWTEKRLAAPKEICSALLGPLQGGTAGPAEYDAVRHALTAHCIDGAFIVSACSAGHKAFPKARINLAQANAGVAADAPVQLLMPSADGEVAAKFADLVARAALAGVQLGISPGTLGFHRSLVASPMGRDTPALTGPVAQMPQGWRLSALDQLPGWPADPADTIACLVSPHGAVTNAQFEGIFMLFGAFAAVDDDRPRTARRSFAWAFERLRQAGAMQNCQQARRKFLGQPRQ